MQQKSRTAIILAAGLIAVTYFGIGWNLISPVAAKSPAEAAPGTPDGDLLTQAQAIFGKLPASMPGSEHDTPAMIALGKNLYFEKAKRPQMSGLEKDYPKLEKKPADAPYPPYIDNLSQERHQYGPFQAMKATRKAK